MVVAMDRTRKNLQALSQDKLITLYLDKQAECNQLKETLVKGRTPTIKPKLKYRTDWSWTQKIVFAVTKLDKPALSSEIMQTLEKYDDHFDFYNDPAKSFSHFMTKASQCKAIIKVKTGGFKGFHYALPDWCDDEGNVLRAYQQKVSLL